MRMQRFRLVWWLLRRRRGMLFGVRQVQQLAATHTLIRKHLQHQERRHREVLARLDRLTQMIEDVRASQQG